MGSKLISLFIGMVVVGLMFGRAAVANEIEDLDRYLGQFTRLERIAFDARGQVVMIPGDKGKTGRGEASGAYHYAFDDGRFVVESQITSARAEYSILDRVGVYAFTGEKYLVYLAKLDVHEAFNEPQKAASILLPNPLVMPLSVLRSDVDSGIALGLEHFDDAGDLRTIRRNIASESIREDDINRRYVEIVLDPDRNVRQHGRAGVHYRVYMHEDDRFGAGFGLPERIEMRVDGERQATIYVSEYLAVETERGVVYLPGDVRIDLRLFAEAIADPARLKMHMDVGTYRTDELPESAFRPDLPGTEISVTEDGEILWDGKPSGCGEVGG